MQQPCSECGKPATHKVVKINKGQLDEAFYCDEHAPGQINQPHTHLQVSLEELLNSLLAQANQQKGADISEQDDFKCGVCGLPFSLYKKTMILGCDRCYESFQAQMEQELLKLHGSDAHVGRQPENFKPSLDKVKAQPVFPESEAAAPVPVPPVPSAPIHRVEIIAHLKQEMDTAVATEDFEKAARIRDRINQLKSELTEHDE